MNVDLIDSMGTDLTVVNAARVSFDKHHKTFTDGDEKLIKYLAEHGHWTPFGHPQLQFRIHAPIFVARQLVKHQIGLVWNEVSRRYVDSPPAFYITNANAGNIHFGIGGFHNAATKMTLNSSGHLSVVGNIGNLITGVSGQVMEDGDEATVTLRFDSDKWRLYSGVANSDCDTG